MQTILFQGDSITDACRDRDSDQGYGLGYPNFVVGRLGCDHPGEYRFLNLGISGDRIVDVYARIKQDIINLRPDVLSILIGVNDVWHELNEQNGVDADKYERIYGMMIEEIRAALPQVKIMILEPFVTHGPATDPKWNIFRGEIEKRAAAAKRTADKYGLAFVPLQSAFDAAEQKADASCWTQEGVHPTPAGHELIAREWVRVFETL